MISLPLKIGIAALWLHYFWSLVPSWEHGEYYQYGFLVAPLAFAFAGRRVGLLNEQKPLPARALSIGPITLVAAVAGLLLLVFIRVVETGDHIWRLPLVLHGLAVGAITTLLLARGIGWKGSLFFLPVVIFAWSAVPYPHPLEQGLVRHLTGWVIGFTREIFLITGHPVEQSGERLILGTQVVEVTEGCSGIRSIQSLIMAALFFGELLLLRWPGRLALIVAALFAAVACNTGRAWFLAWIQFSKGLDAARAAHDLAGHVAFVVSALILYLVARCSVPRAPTRMVVRNTFVSTP